MEPAAAPRQASRWYPEPVDVITAIALAAPAGLNAYIPLLAVALADRFGFIALQEPYSVLSEWWMIGILAALLVVEIIADKVPAVDTFNDGIQTVVRPAAGGLLAVSAAGAADVPPVVLVVVGVLLAGGVHAAKASARPAINTATAGTGAPFVSVAEDVMSAVLSVMALIAPAITALVVLLGLAAVVWGVIRLRRKVRREQ